MREIKFRAWHEESETMVYFDNNVVKNDIYQQGYLFNMIANNSKMLMQYTGFKDKNGREIFEGDIVKSTAMENDNYQKGAVDVLNVKFFMGAFRLSFPGQELGVPIYPFNITNSLEVITTHTKTKDLSTKK